MLQLLLLELFPSSGVAGMVFNIILLPWLVPSSGVAGIADDRIPSCCRLLYCPLSDPPVSCLSCTRLSILGLAALFLFSLVCPHLAFFSLCAPLSFSSHGRTTSVVFSVIFLEPCTTLVVPLMSSFRIFSPLVTPHIHLSIPISFTASRASCPLVVAQVSAP